MLATDFFGTQWWQTGVIYQIYPRSFQDTNGDGVGDLPGITARLEYLAGLGVTALWISPFYPSPMADFGYDVADYTGVDAIFGTLADFDNLLAAAHAQGLRVILDFVPNHTSDQHPWFVESRSSRGNPKRDWYLWHDPAPQDQAKESKEPSRRLPNNWTSHFGGPAWTWDDTTQQFYCHSFLKQQPDLNWRNPAVQRAIFKAMRFWLDRGVDGFRMDVLWLLIKDELFRDNPPNPDYHPGLHDIARTLPVYTADQPETHRIVADMRVLLYSYGPTLPAAESSPRSFGTGADEMPFMSFTRIASTAVTSVSHRVLIGEIYLPLPELVRYYGEPEAEGATESPAPEIPVAAGGIARPGANLPFNFHLIQTPWTAEDVAQVITTYEALLPPGAWPNYVLGNHDQPRLASRLGPLQARVAAMLLLTLRGTPTLYYGDELGMTDVPIAPGQVQDPAEKNEPGKGRGRDPERSPMVWVDAPNAGFTTPDVEPWLPLQADWATSNAAVQRKDPRSFLSFYRHLLHLRGLHDTLRAGAIDHVQTEGSVLSFRRLALPEGDSTDFQVLLNLGSVPAVALAAPGTLVLTTLLDGRGSLVDGPVTLEGGEGLLIALH